MKGTNVPIDQKIEISQGFEEFVKARNQAMILRNVIDIFILGYELKNVQPVGQIRNSSESITSGSLPESRLKARSTSGCKY